MRTRKLARQRGWITLDIHPEIDFNKPFSLCVKEFGTSHAEMNQWCRERIGIENYKSFQIFGNRDDWRSRFLFKGEKYLTFFELAWISK